VRRADGLHLVPAPLLPLQITYFRETIFSPALFLGSRVHWPSQRHTGFLRVGGPPFPTLRPIKKTLSTAWSLPRPASPHTSFVRNPPVLGESGCVECDVGPPQIPCLAFHAILLSCSPNFILNLCPAEYRLPGHLSAGQTPIPPPRSPYLTYSSCAIVSEPTSRQQNRFSDLFLGCVIGDSETPPPILFLPLAESFYTVQHCRAGGPVEGSMAPLSPTGRQSHRVCTACRTDLCLSFHRP